MTAAELTALLAPARPADTHVTLRRVDGVRVLRCEGCTAEVPMSPEAIEVFGDLRAEFEKTHRECAP